jgi:hypothetical protein
MKSFANMRSKTATRILSETPAEVKQKVRQIANDMVQSTTTSLIDSIDLQMKDNELIEKFWVEQGGKPHLMADISFYENDWNMLMPVVEKIAEYRLAYPDQANEVCNLKVVVLQSALYKRVVQFIKWYNENIKP